MVAKPARVPPTTKNKGKATAKKPIESHTEPKVKAKKDGMIARATTNVRKGK